MQQNKKYISRLNESITVFNNSNKINMLHNKQGKIII